MKIIVIHTLRVEFLFNEAPDILPNEMYKKIKRQIAERILSTNKEKWTTVNDFYFDCDNLRENDDKMFSV